MVVVQEPPGGGHDHHLILEDTSGLFLSWEKSLRGSMPQRKVTAAIVNRVITWADKSAAGQSETRRTFSVTRVRPSSPAASPAPAASAAPAAER